MIWMETSFLENGFIEFAVRNKHRLKAGWLVTCGGCYNFVTGAYKRAPEWVQAIGMEWLFRVVQEPGRLFHRYRVTNGEFLRLALDELLKAQ